MMMIIDLMRKYHPFEGKIFYGFIGGNWYDIQGHDYVVVVLLDYFW